MSPSDRVDVKKPSYRISSPHFNLAATLESGQVFGFTRKGEVFRGAVYGRAVELRQRGKEIVCAGSDPASIRRYFDLDHDVSAVFRILEEEDCLRPLTALGGLRLIRQDAWEALACFILSSNNNVKRIQGIWRNLAAGVGEGNGTFPSAREVSRCHERRLRELGLGYRAPFLQRSALFVAANPSSLEAIREAEYDAAVERVIAFPGIGPKVADCVLLYGFHKLEAFPVDVWIARVMRRLYFRGRSVSLDRIHRYGRKKWGNSAGYVQQYLFHGARTGIL